jgi:hypothetical protein
VALAGDALQATSADATGAEPAGAPPRPNEGESSATAAPLPGAPGDLIRRALRLLGEKRGDVWVNKREIWPMVKRLDPTFELAEHGFTTFSAMLKSLEEMIETRKGEYDQQVRLR